MNDETPKAEELHFEIAPIESITKAEVDCQIATAHQFPRSIAQFYKRAEAMVTSDQETAESCLYRLTRKDKRTGEVKIIEGESVRMAEIVAACYGNMRSAVHIIGHTATRVTVRAAAHDLETNNLMAVEKQAKTAYSDGTPYNEDLAIMTANATVSKALRDAIFRVVPKALVKPLKEKAKLVAFGSGQAFLERRRKALDWATKTRKVPLERVLAVLGVKGEEDIGVEHLEVLTGLKTAIMEGDQTVDEAFPELDMTKPLFEHPAQTQPKQEPTPEPVAEEPKKKAKKKEEPVAQPQPETSSDEAAEAAMGLAPEQKEPENVVKMPEAKEPEPAKEEAPAPVVENVSPQMKLKEIIEKAGFTFMEFAQTFTGAIFPKNQVPGSWQQVPVEKATYFSSRPDGVLTAIKNWRARQLKK